LKRELESINSFANVRILEKWQFSDFSDAELKSYSLVVFGFKDIPELIDVCNWVHLLDIPFLATWTLGVYSLLYIDLGKEYECFITSKNEAGEDIKT